MAQLVWRPVEAPRLDNRDLALAGAQISSSFDRMGQMLFDREATLRQQATDEQAAAVLLANDEAGVDAAAQAALGTGNRRVNGRVIAELAAQQKNTVLSREGLRQENVLRDDQIKDKQGANAIAPIDASIRELMWNGKFEEADAQIQAIAAEDPIAARGIRQRTDTWWNARTGGIAERRTQLNDDRTHERGQQQLALEGQRVALTRQQHEFERNRVAQADRGLGLATTFAQDYRLADTATAKAKLYENPNFQQLMKDAPTTARSVLDNFDAAHAALTAETADVKTGFREIDSGIAAQTTALGAAANRAENLTRTPAVQAARRALGNDGKITANDVIAKMSELGPYFNQSTAATDYNYVMENVPGARPEDLSAAIEQYGLSSGWWTKNVLPTNMDDVLKTHVEQIVKARNAGYTQNADLDVATARSPYESKAAEIKSLRAEMTRYARADAANAQLSPAQLEARKKAEARLERLLGK